MGRRLVGTVLFLGVAMLMILIAGGLASEGRATCGWFLGSGMMLSGVALNLWTGEVPEPGCPRCQKPPSLHDLE